MRTDDDILNAMAEEGRVTLGMLTGILECDKAALWQRLCRLVKEGKVRKVAKGLYEVEQ